MSSENAIRFAGDVTIEKLELVSLNGFGQDVTNQIVAFEIYEDIFSPFITGTLALRESIDYAGLFPLVGEEYINIRIKTPTFDDKNMMIDDQFFIYKMTNRNMVGDRNVIYELHFISREAIVDMNKRISKSYEGNVSDLAKEILSDKINGLETTKNILTEPTENSTKYISNYWSPVKNVNFLAECAKNGNGVPNYLFFENRYGFNFGSLDTLSISGIKQSFTYDQYYRTPRIWFEGTDGGGGLLTQNEIYSDFMVEYIKVSLTLEVHPILNMNCISVHPCKHAFAMQKMFAFELEKKDVSEVKIEDYIVHFLKFASCVIPQLEFDKSQI